MAEATGSQQPIVCVGEAMIVLTPADDVPLRDADAFVRTVGGAELNVALTLAGLDHLTGLQRAGLPVLAIDLDHASSLVDPLEHDRLAAGDLGHRGGLAGVAVTIAAPDARIACCMIAGEGYSAEPISRREGNSVS